MASFKIRGRDLEAEFRSNGRLACQLTRAESGAVSRRKAKIDPQVQKCDNESRAKQPPPHGQECPEDAGVAELPHPQPLLYQAGDAGQESDEDDRCDNDEFQRTPSPEDAVSSTVLPFPPAGGLGCSTDIGF